MIHSTLENLNPETWTKITWEEFLALAESPEYSNGKCYYEQGRFRIEMAPIGLGHSQDNGIIYNLVSLYAALKKIPVRGLVNCSFRKVGVRECQPDSAFYLGANFNFPPRTNSPIDLNKYDPPSLVVEHSATSLENDLGWKRFLYERLGVREYWIVDANSFAIIAFQIIERGSQEIQESQVLPALKIATIEEALKRSETEDDGQINRWLIQEFSQS